MPILVFNTRRSGVDTKRTDLCMSPLRNCPSRCDLTHSHRLAFNKTLDIKNKSCLYELGKVKVSDLFHTCENWGWGLPGWMALVKFLRGSLVPGERSWWTCSGLDEGLEKKANGKTHNAMCVFAFSGRENIVLWWWAQGSPLYGCTCRRTWGSVHACYVAAVMSCSLLPSGL